MKAIPYMHPTIYNLYLLALHGKSLEKRYRFISGEIGGGQRVFEPGCGTGILADYLYKSCDYVGWDMNPTFVTYLKRKGYNVEMHDILDFENYPENDVCVIVDVLHHIVPKEQILIKNALKTTKKLIVVEPYEAFSFPLPYRIRKYYDSFLGDNDGINPYDNRVNWAYSPEELKKYFTSLGAHKIAEIGKDIMAVFHPDKCE